MTVYATNSSIDPLKQAGQFPSYNIQPNSTEYYHTQPQDQDAVPRNKPTAGQRFHKISSKAGSPLNKAANLVGAEGWWPTTMDKECAKAARILHSFTNLSSSTSPNSKGPLHPTGLTRKSMIKIPPAVLQTAAGLAIFNVIRAGACHGSLSGGSGVVISRRSDGTWSPPSSFIVSTLGAGFVFGLDVYDCICVLNTPEQVAAFTKPRVSLGAEGSVAVGPVGTGGSIEAALSKTAARPVWSYMKSRGLWAGVQIDGTIVVARGDANAVFYNERGITAEKILLGDVAWPMAAKPLFEVLQALEGWATYDRTVVQAVGESPTPGDSILSEKQEIYTDEPEEYKIGGYEKSERYTDEPEEPEIGGSEKSERADELSSQKAQEPPMLIVTSPTTIHSMEDLPDYEVVKKD
jgi:lipid-binding SYLF domain-containing protein